MASLQKKLAAKILKVGVSRIWLDPSKKKEIEEAITKADVRKLIEKGFIKVLKEKIRRKEEKKRRRRGPGSRKGGKYAIVSKKRRWINTVRPLRRMLKELKESGKIDNTTYRKLRKLVKGGVFRSRSHLLIYLKQRGILEEE